MKRFLFRLETLLELRKRSEDAVKQKLAAKNRQIILVREEMAELHSQLTKFQSSEKANRNNATNVITLRYSVAYRYKLKQDLLRKGQEIEKLNSQIFAVHKELVKVTRDRRAIEIVRERQFDAWKKEYHAQEQAFMDDLSQQGYIRRFHAAKDRG